MMHYSHLAFGLLVSLLSIEFLGIKNKVLFVLIVLFFSRFPDIDLPHSKIGKKHKILSSLLNFIFGHRGFLHALYVPIILFFIIDLINYEFALATFIGYVSHLFLDALTKAGIKPLYPLLNIKINGPLKTNTFFEKIIFFVMIVCNVLLIWNYFI